MILRDLYKKYERWVPIGAFLGGFIFDAIVLTRIDEPEVIIQQALYLLMAAFLIGVELIELAHGKISAPRFLSRVWTYREAVLHFMLGTLLNSYAIFYFKSASAVTSLLFIGLLIALLTINEFKHFGKSQAKVHVALLSLCLISYLVSLAPIALGFIGKIPFLCAMILSVVVFVGYCRVLRPRLVLQPGLFKTHLLYPYAAIQTIFIGLYFAHAIPPVPLSVKYLGVFHGAEKVADGYELSYTRPEWKFWQHGDQTFTFRPGDVIHCYTQIFSPARFKDQLQVRWLYWDEKRGWLPSDAIALSVVGGREEGFRAVTKKSNFQPGAWRVQIETIDSHEIGRIGFTVVPDESSGEREFHTILK